jgi:hypothetical protein
VIRSILFPTPTRTKYAVLFVLFCASIGAHAALAWTGTGWLGFAFAPLSVFGAVFTWNHMERYS